jgi:hypothetical protein
MERILSGIQGNIVKKIITVRVPARVAAKVVVLLFIL